MKRWLIGVLLRAFLVSLWGWMPSAWAATIANDTFTEASTVVLSAHTPSPTGTSWTTTSASLVVNSGDYVTSSSNTGGTVFWGVEQTTVGDDDMDVTLTVTTTTDNTRTGGPIGRVPAGETGNNCYWTVIRGTDGVVELNVRSAGSDTQLGTYTNATDDATLKLELRTAAKKVYVDGTERISSANDSVTGGTYAGLRMMRRTGNTGDNFLSVSVDAGVATRRVMLISRLFEWMDRWMIRPVYAADADTRPLGYYLSTVCGTGREQEVSEDFFVPDPRHPCLVDTAGFSDWVLLWDDGTTMLFKAAAERIKHDETPTMNRVGEAVLDTTKLSVNAERYLSEHGEGRISGR